MNVVLACVVDKAAQARVDDLSGESVKRKLMALCEDLDDDDSGEITFAELKAGFANNRDFKRRMTQMDIHEQEIDVVWDILDADKSGTIGVVEFVEELSKLKKANMHTMLLIIRHYVMEIRNKVNSQLQMMRDDLEKAEKRELEVAEAMRREEQELSRNLLKSMGNNANSAGPPSGDEAAAPTPMSRAPPAKAANAQVDKVEEKMNDNKDIGIGSAFMAEQRQFMADMIRSTNDIKGKIEVFTRPLSLGTTPGSGEFTEQLSPFIIRPATRDGKTCNLPDSRPGLPVALCPLSTCSTSRGGSDRPIIRPTLPAAPPPA